MLGRDRILEIIHSKSSCNQWKTKAQRDEIYFLGGAEPGLESNFPSFPIQYSFQKDVANIIIPHVKFGKLILKLRGHLIAPEGRTEWKWLLVKLSSLAEFVINLSFQNYFLSF